MDILALLPFISVLLVTAFGNRANETEDDPQITYYRKNLETLIDTIRKKSYGEDDERVGLSLLRYNFLSDGCPEEFGTYYQGDILTFTESESKTYLWEHGVVPYFISEDIHNDFDRARIMAAISEFHMHTCIKFTPYDSKKHTDFIMFERRPTGCWSSIGRMGGRQTVNLQSPQCITQVKTILHELGHALGLLHEHTRPIRDAAVIIKWENIKRGFQGNFVKDELEAFDIPYDTRSIMHYSEIAYSGNKKETILSWTTNEINRTKLGYYDIKKLRILYKCDHPFRSRIE